MRNKLSLILIFSILLVLTAITTQPIFATVRCETQYGGGQVCVKTGELQINKKVWDSQNQIFVDNLGITSHKFTSGEEIVFQIEIKNVGDETFDKVDVQDTLPNYLELSSGELFFTIENLEPGESETREIRVKVVSVDKLPNDKTLICDINTAEGWTDSEKDKDTTQICIEKRILGITRLPPTGPKGWLIISLLSLTSSSLGIYLLISRKKLQREVKI